MRLIIFILTALWCDPSSFGNARVEARARDVPKRFHRLWKRQDDLGYLDQCSILQFWDKQIGRVNVLAFFDSSWPFSHRQAAMLRVLRERFDKTGFDNIQFFAINAAADEARYIDRAEIEIEEETWKQISPSEAEGLPPVIVSPEALIEALGPDVYFIQDNEALQIWYKLRAFRDQILVIDRCGRLTYQIIVPWSILHFPYVKAAILSTYKDEPCGYCQFKEILVDTATADNQDTLSPSEESSTLIHQTEHNNKLSTMLLQETSTVNYEAESTQSILDVSSTPVVPTEKDETSPLLQESSTLSDGDENNDDATSILEESSTVKTDINDITPTTTQVETEKDMITDDESPSTFSEESTTLSDQIESNNTFSKLKESSAVISRSYDSEDPLSYFQNPSTASYHDEINDTSTFSEKQSTPIIQTETDSTFDTSTSLYSPINVNSNTDEFANIANSEYTGDSSDSTTNKDFLYTMEEVETRMTDETSINNSTDKLEIDNTTEQQILETDIQTTTDLSNLSSETQESRLTDSGEIESLDSRDVLKSRSTNARSVSPNDGSENHLEVVDINENNQETMESDFLIPIRIIMRAPHVDEYSDQTMKAHEYLVLKTGQPDYHEHLDNEEEHKPIRKKAEAVRRSFDKDESTGLYGEVADYWRNFGNEQLTQSSYTEEDDDQNSEENINYTDDGVTLSSTTLSFNNGRSGTEHPYENPEVVPIKEATLDNGNVYDHSSDLKEEVDIGDEEAKSKLIAHYSKLLPWLYYVLAK